MHALHLAPLPSETGETSRAHALACREGFVDERVVSSVIARGAYDRICAMPEGIALSSSADDYAGWVLPVASPFRVMAATPSRPATPARLPGEPSLRKDAEPGIDAPYEGGHRWWFFGMSGAMACGIMALTIFGLAQRHEMMAMPPSPVVAGESRGTPAAEGQKPAPQPALTTVLPAEP